MGVLQKIRLWTSRESVKKVSKIDPQNSEKTARGRSFGTSKPGPQKGHKIEHQKWKSPVGGGLGRMAPGAELLGDDKVIDKIYKVIQHALHPLRGAANMEFLGISAPGGLI